MTPVRRICVLGAIVFVAATSIAAQQPPQVPTFRTSIDIVRLDVSVLDRQRNPIRNLKQGDFTVLVDGVEQPIVAFEPVEIAPIDHSLAPWTRAVASDVRDNLVGEPRIFIIVIDDASTPHSDLWMWRTGRELARSVVDEMRPGDLAAVTYTFNGRHAQDLTSDRAKLLAAIEKYTPQAGLPMAGRMVQDTLRNLFTAMRQRTIGGRAAVMWISTGAVNVERLRLDRGFGERVENAYSLITEVNELAREARVSNLPVYGFSIAGLMAPGPTWGISPVHYRQADAGNEVLRYIADRSGGRAVYNTNAPVRRVPEVMNELSAYYVLGYRATYPTDDRKTRRLRIKVNHPDAQVFPDDRPMLPVPQRKPPKMTPETPLLLAMSDILPQRGIPLRVAVAPVATDTKSRAAVALALGVEHPAPGEPLTERVDVLTRIFTPDGEPVTRLAHTADIKWVPSETSSREGQYEVLSRLDLKPGRYLLRTSVHSASRNKTGSVYADLTIPDFRKEPLSMSGVVLSATPGVRAVPKDAVATLLPVVPTAEREFSGSQTVNALVRLYQAEKKAAQPVVFRATITDAVGLDVWSHADTVPASRFDARRAADVTFAVPLDKLADGEYLMTITATAGEHRRELHTRFARK